jgi:divalent metal cation (Fe/Co/Zn/Cd) transporter
MTKGSDYINYIISEEELSPIEQLKARVCGEDYYMELKRQAMDELDYTEEEMEIDSIEDEVNRYADNLFFEEFGVHFQDIEE